MFKIKLILAILVSLASFLWLSPAGAQPFPKGNFKELHETGKADVLEVISPQTMKLSNGDIIHLVGLHFTDDTPQDAGPFALTALKILKDMLEGETVLIYQTRQKDRGRTNRMGHVLAHIVRQKDMAWAQGTLAGLGLAQVQTSLRNPEMAAQLYALERYARKEKLGIWAKDAQVLTPEGAKDYVNSFQIVEGVIESAALKKNRVYLNFGNSWRDDFTVSIPPAHRREFSKAGLNPFDWNGQRVRVRGWVEDYNGPYIEIDHPAAIELLSE
jgi:hypothetical protein